MKQFAEFADTVISIFDSQGEHARWRVGGTCSAAQGASLPNLCNITSFFDQFVRFLSIIFEL